MVEAKAASMVGSSDGYLAGNSVGYSVGNLVGNWDGCSVECLVATRAGLKAGRMGDY